VLAEPVFVNVMVLLVALPTIVMPAPAMNWIFPGGLTTSDEGGTTTPPLSERVSNGPVTRLFAIRTHSAFTTALFEKIRARIQISGGVEVFIQIEPIG
jgi:hypothetical protein